MAFTKITAAGIGSTETVTLDGVSVINNESIGGNLTVTGNATIGGVLTYEDVTNVDSVGLVTARNGIVVGSGITLSKDGDVFFTGIATGNGSGLTALNASNLGSGTVPTARLGSGTASSSTFLRGDSSFQTVNTDLVSDTSPQLGGDLASNGNDINVAADDRVVFGTDKLRIKHTDSNADIENTTGNIVIKNDSSSTSEQIILQAKGGEDSVKAVADGAVELYHDNSKKLETVSGGVTVTGTLTATTFSGISTASTSDFVQVSRYTVPGEVSEVEIDFDNTNYTHFKIFVTSQNNAYDSNVYVRFKVGGSYQTGSSYYTGTVKKHQGGFDTSTYGGANQSYGYLIDNVGGDNSTYERWAIIGDINTGTSDGPGFMRYDSYHKGSSADYANTMGIVAYQNFGVLQGIRFYNSSGNLEGGAIYTLYGLK